MIPNDDEEEDWPTESSLSRQFSALDDLLRCPICCEFYTNPQSLKCGHTFCSICIRKHLDSQLNKTSHNKCPSCRENADSQDLLRNTVASAVAQQFASMRKDVIRILQGVSSNSDEVEFISKDSSSSSAGAGITIVKRLAQYNCHGLKREKVKAILLQLSGESRIKLRVDGEKDTMERRLREFIHLSNAQLGSAAPMTLEQVIRTINDQETQQERESAKTARSASKLEKVKNGQVVQDVEDNFAMLARKVREQKQAALKRQQSSNDNNNNSNNSDTPANATAERPSAGVEPTASSEQSEARAQQPHFPARSEAEVEETAKLVCELENLLKSGVCDYGPWRVALSTKLARPFFYNTLTGMGQFAVPPELQQAISELNARPATVTATKKGEKPGGGAEAAERTEMPSAEPPPLQPEHSQRSSRRRTPSSQPSQPDQPSASQQPNKASQSQPHSSEHGRFDQDEEESPFHMLVNSQNSAGMPTFSVSGASSGTGAAARSGVSQFQEHTAASTAREVPKATPYPVGGVESVQSAVGLTEMTDLTALSQEDGDSAAADAGHDAGVQETSRVSKHPVSPTAALFPASAVGIAESGKREWSCAVCTYLNSIHTYTCAMCNTVDKAEQSRFSKPLLRSGLIVSSGSSSGGGKSGGFGVGSQLSGASQKKRLSQGSSSGGSKKGRR